MRLPAIPSGPLPRLLAVAALSLVTISLSAQTYQLQTGDGLLLEVDQTGLVKDLQVEGNALLGLGLSGGFTITDYTGLSGTNLLFNSGFEGGSVNQSPGIDVPANWTLVTAQGAEGDIALNLDSSAAYEGTNSLYFRTTQRAVDEPPQDPDILELSSDRMAVAPGTCHYVTGFFRSLQGIFTTSSWLGYSVEVYLDWYDSGDQFLDDDRVIRLAQTAHNWARYSGRAVPPDTAATVSVRLRVTGNVDGFTGPIELWVDRMAFFHEPAGIRDLPVTGTVTDLGGALQLDADNVGGRGLTVNTTLTAHADRIEVSGQVTPSAGAEGQDRAFDLCFVLPVDTEATTWWWYDNLRKRYEILDSGIYDESVNLTETTSDLKLSVYNLSCISNEISVLNFGRDPDLVRAVHIYFDGTRGLYIIKFQLGLAPEHEQAGFDFILYTSPPSWGFRGSLRDYYAVYPDYGVLRDVGGVPLRGGVDASYNQFVGTPYETDPDDFGVRYFHSSIVGDTQHLVDDLGMTALLYSEPWSVEFLAPVDQPPPPYQAYEDAVHGDSSVFTENEIIESFPGDFLLTVNDTTGQDLLCSRITNFPNHANPYQYFGAVYINPNDQNETFGDRYLVSVDESYQYFFNQLGSYDYLSGVMMDLTNYGSNTLDGTRSRFATAGSDLTYCPNSLKPALWNLSSYLEYQKSLRAKLAAEREDRDILSANAIEYGFLFSASKYIDLFGCECSPISGFNWGSKNLDYRRIMARDKPVSPVLTYKEALPFDEPSGEFYKGMRDLWNICLLYGLYLDQKKFCELNGQDLEQMREVTREVVPWIDQLLAEGWNPCSYVVKMDAEGVPLTPLYEQFIQVERYGPDPETVGEKSCYIVVLYNDRNFRVFDTLFPKQGYLPDQWDFWLKADLNEIGMVEPVVVEELTASIHDMEPTVPPNLVVNNHGDGTVTISGTVDYRDALIIRITEDRTPPDAPEGVAAEPVLP